MTGPGHIWEGSTALSTAPFCDLFLFRVLTVIGILPGAQRAIFKKGKLLLHTRLLGGSHNVRRSILSVVTVQHVLNRC